MKKSKFILIALALVLFAGTLFYVNFSQQITQNDEILDESSSSDVIENNSDVSNTDENIIITSMSETFHIDSQTYTQGEVIDNSKMNVSFNGEMDITVNSAILSDYTAGSYEDLNDTWANSLETYISDLEMMKLFATDFPNNIPSEMLDEVLSEVSLEELEIMVTEQASYYENFSPSVLTLDISIENISAEQSSGIKYEFYTSIFSLIPYEYYYTDEFTDDMMTEQYVHEAYLSVHGDDTDYYKFILEPGETYNFEVSYLLYYPMEDYVLNIYNNGDLRLGIHLDDVTEKRK